ncbi:MAG: ACT domain-containing protein, partial [Candidatus Omnitrophica bacterium]|nr:ACT domain-containing protein [Candidatus Omnitrophota bacterium]
MPIQKQLSIFLPNRPGVLAHISSVLAEADVNILALSVHDTVDNAVIRLVLDNPTKALLLLEREELYIMEQDVVILAVDNQPGILAKIAQKLAHADINI